MRTYILKFYDNTSISFDSTWTPMELAYLEHCIDNGLVPKRVSDFQVKSKKTITITDPSQVLQLA